MRIIECSGCGGTLKEVGKYFQCENCGTRYAIGRDDEGNPFTYSPLEKKQILHGLSAEKSPTIQVSKVAVKELKLSQTIADDVQKEALHIDIQDRVGLIESYVEIKNWDAAQGELNKLLKEDSDSAEARWFGMMCDRKVPNDEKLLSTFSNFSVAEKEWLDKVLSTSNPSFAKRIMDLLFAGAYANDSMCLNIISVVLPYAMNESVYNSSEFIAKTSYAFERVISSHFTSSFEYLISSALSETDVDRYINYVERYADSAHTTAAEKQDYYSRILEVDSGNLRIHRKLVNADLQADAGCSKCISDFESLLKYATDIDNETFALLSGIISRTPTTINKAELMWQVLGYHSHAPEGLKNEIIKYAKALLSVKLWQQAEKFLYLILSFDARDAETYFLLCLAKMHLCDESKIATCKDDLIQLPEFAKSLSLYQRSQKPEDVKRAKELLSLTKRQKSIKKIRKTIIIAGISVAVVAVGLLVVVGIGKILELQEQKRSKAYDYAIYLYSNEQWDAAYQAFLDLGDYKDSKNYLAASKDKIDENNRAEEEKKANYDLAVDLFDAGEYDEALKAFQKIAGYKDSDSYISKCQDGINETKYSEATNLFNEGKYDEALQVFMMLQDYKDSSSMVESCKEKITEVKYENAMRLLESEQYEEAIKAFEELNGYKDSKDRIEQCKRALTERKYQNAITLYNEGKYKDALTIFTELGNYKESEHYKSFASIKCAKVGDIIPFGKYEQDDNSENGAEYIDWIVLDKKGNKLLVLSKDIIDWMNYTENGAWREAAWDNCIIRKWLNDDFYNAAFTNKEKKIIKRSAVKVDELAMVYLEGSETNDYLFLLGKKEFESYCASKNIAKATRTVYAQNKANSLLQYVWQTTKDQWWLRYRNENYDSCVMGVDYDGNPIKIESHMYAGIRPAMWITIP